MCTTLHWRSDRGFTLVELMMAVMLIGIIGAMAVFQVAAVRPGMLADGAMRAVIGQLNLARETALSQRREVSVQWNLATHVLTLVLLPIPPDTTNVTLSQISFEGGVRYGLLPGASDTPDAFGNSSAATFGAAQVRFTTDGSLVDNSGAPVNGTFFLLIPDVGGSFRAVTVLGSTGRVRGYRWTGTQWTRV